MRRALRQPLAVAFAVLVVTAGALGTAILTDEDVTTLDDASNQFVQRGAAFSPTDGLILGYASGVIETYQDFIGDNQPSDEMNQTDLLEARKDVYSSLATQAQNNRASRQTYSNYLNDTKTVALMTGKNAYAKALERDATQGEAELAAHEAVQNYYVTKQENIITTWNVTMDLHNTSAHSIVSAGDIQSLNDNFKPSGGAFLESENTVGTYSVQLVDGTSTDAKGIEILDSTTNDPYTVKPGHTGGGSTLRFAGVGELDPLTYFNYSAQNDLWNRIEVQNSDVQGQLSDFIEATYGSYEAGDLEGSDLVDPYLGAREYSPETSETWGIRTLSAMGVSPPENLSSIGLMNVSAGGTIYRGVLMSDDTPASGFGINETYNATTLSGPQFVALSDGGTKELSGAFTLKSATRSDGTEYTENESVTYKEVNYSTANLEEFTNLTKEINNLTTQINARQQRLRNAGGTGWLPDVNLGGLGSAAPIVLIAGGAVVLLART